MNNELLLNIAGIYLKLHLVNPLTSIYFQSFIYKDQFPHNIQSIPAVDKTLLKEEAVRLRNSSYAEYSLLFESAANMVLPLNRFFFHGAAFIWRGSAYIFAGKSGIGKTTQLFHWLNLFPEEIEIINGDKPIIEVKNDKFIVHPSPWGGKEGFNGSKSAELRGIILLEQGTIDQINVLSIKDTVFPLFLQFLFKPDDIQTINRICNYEEKLLSTVPVWTLINRGTEESALLTHSFLVQEVFDEI